MASPTVSPPAVNITALAKRLLADIRRRGLIVGDRYLTAEEAARMLGVRKAVAGQAIRQLAERDILIPRRRAGTFVGPGLGKQKRSQVRTVFVLLPAGDLVASHWAYEPFVAGLRREVSDVNVQFTFVPEDDPIGYVRELIDSARAAGQFAGVVSVSCPPETYRYLAELAVPAVVFGSLYWSDLALGCVDLDNYRSGQLMTQHLIARGHRRIALLMTAAGRPGNNLFLDGISDALTAAGLPPNALLQRLLPNDIEAFQAVAGELLRRAERPTAVLTRGNVQADAVALVAESLGLAVPAELEIVHDTEGQMEPRSQELRACPRVRPTLSFMETAAAIGKLLKDMAEAMPAAPRVMIPVELVLPPTP